MRPEQDDFMEHLFRAHFHELEVYAFCFLHDWNQAQAAVQDAFYIACKKTDQLMESPNPLGWMKNTVKNVAHNLLREQRRRARLLVSLEEIPFELPAPDSGEEELLAEHCAALVSREELTLLKRIALDGVTYVEAAEEFGISMWACRKRVQRTVQRLRNELEKEK